VKNRVRSNDGGVLHKYDLCWNWSRGFEPLPHVTVSHMLFTRLFVMFHYSFSLWAKTSHNIVCTDTFSLPSDDDES
jgi:hypothetical protein